MRLINWNDVELEIVNENMKRRIVTGEKMLAAWKYVIVICTIVAAIITPSTDPVTQILLSTALLSLYLGGSGFVILLKK